MDCDHEATREMFTRATLGVKRDLARQWPGTPKAELYRQLRAHYRHRRTLDGIHARCGP